MNTDIQARADGLLDKVHTLLPRIRERTEECKAGRRVPAETVSELQDAGFFLALQPARYGGLELMPQHFFRAQMALAEACMSTAWACGIVAVHAYQLALMDERAQQDVWGDSIHTRVSSSYAPMGKVEKVEGGFRFSGRWGWSSGCDHCTWVLLGGIVPDEGYRTFLIPREDYDIEDTWQVMGLQGTGSNDIVVKDAFVPDYRTHKQMDGFLGTNPGKAVNPQVQFQFPWAQLFIRTVSSPAIGACRAALRLAIKGANGKASNDPTKLAGDTATLERLAQADCSIDELEALLYRNFDHMQARLERNESIPLSERARYRLQAGQVIERCMGAVDSLFSSAGGRSVFLDSEIQQRFMDIHTARAHVANNPTPFLRNHGGLLLGLENSDVFI